ncbi:MAG: type VI secretion system tube protein Hcp [Actinomycetota bacterium]|nr:type VI secretion system tube protein Hcp [Actinomycetota bacterium]
MPLTFFLRLDDIPGESADSRHAKEIELLRWSWGLENSGGVQFGGGGGAGKVAFSPLQVTKQVDSASPALMALVASGKHIATGTLTVVTVGDPGRDVLEVAMEDILVTAWTTEEATGNDWAEEDVSLTPVKVTVTHRAQNPDGTLAEPQVFGWDVRANQKV